MRSRFIVAMLATLLAACSGTASATTPSPSAAPAPTVGSAAARTTPAPTAVARVSPAPVTPSASVGGPAQPQACALLSRDDVGAVLSGRPIAGPDVNQSGGNDCMYGVKADLSAVYLVVLDAGAFEASRAKPVSGSTFTPVGALGDDAFFVANDLVRAELFVATNDLTFAILVKNGDFTVDQLEAAEKSTAQRVLARL